MLRRITKKSDSAFTLDEVAQELRYFEKYVSESFDSDSDQLTGFEYACELFGKSLEEKIEELEKECEHEFVKIENEKVSGVKICIHCKELEIG